MARIGATRQILHSRWQLQASISCVVASSLTCGRQPEGYVSAADSLRNIV